MRSKLASAEAIYAAIPVKKGNLLEMVHLVIFFDV